MQELAYRMEKIGAGKKLAQASDVCSELKHAFEQTREFLQAHLRSLESPAGKAFGKIERTPSQGPDDSGPIPVSFYLVFVVEPEQPPDSLAVSR